METLLNKLNQLSYNLIERLGNCEMEELVLYMEERDELFAKLQQTTPDRTQVSAFRPLVELILKQDVVIMGRMMELRNNANQEIEKINIGKRSKSMYDTGSYGDESMFFDTKR
ncbi:hypothetical protein [Paenibacillus luteus]|uniref:hypothetical protein n=1 Tax=Paenibacillus luteus TaxID=2545753 RepID=UPI0011415AA3|nr:hypothetical protein [Paenibacillus luteus]